MKTNTANWDYARQIPAPAPYNAICPICGHGCYSGTEPDGSKFYTCPACMEMEHELNADEDRRSEIDFARYGH